MSLPACERRVLHQMEGALRASEPHLAAMYAIFARLNAGEPVDTEALGRGRLLRRGPAVGAMVLVPVMFAMVVIGVLFSGSARGITLCGASPSTVRGAPLVSRTSCSPGSAQARGATQVKASTQGKASTQVKAPGTAVPASSASPKGARGDAVLREAAGGSLSCASRIRDAQPRAPGEHVSSPPAAYTTVAC